MGHAASSNASKPAAPTQPHPPAAVHAALAARHGQKVLLFNEESAHNLRANGDGSVDAKGDEQPGSHWTLNHAGGDIVTLQSPATSGWLRSDKFATTSDGDGQDKACKFKVVHHPTGAVSLLTETGHPIGFDAQGNVRPAGENNVNQRNSTFLFQFV